MNVRDLFAFERPVDRRMYFTVGLTLMVLKYLVDAAVLYLATDVVWTPLDYLTPSLSLRSEKLLHVDGPVLLGLALWTVPFIWIGVSMTVRRAADAGLSPWLGLAFLIPIGNYVLMVALSLLPSRHGDYWNQAARVPVVRDRLWSAVVGIAAGVFVGVLGVVVSVYGAQAYGAGLFFLLPVMIGAVSAYIYNRGHARTMQETQLVTMLALVLVGGALLAVAIEGVICVVMAAIPAYLAGAIGAVVGRAIAVRAPSRTGGAVAAVLVLPIGFAVDARVQPSDVRTVTTVVTVQAPPERVWPHVVQFSDIGEPREWIFRAGIAYPVRATIDREGIGAVRRCEFSTGSFVEPVTIWDPPRRLTFDVSAQPEPMTELTPYNDIDAPHLHGFFEAVRGEFRLIPIDGGRATRLEGTTWYRLRLSPAAYWRFVTDALVHRIHSRVLDHIAAVSQTTSAPSLLDTRRRDVSIRAGEETAW